MVQRGGKFSGAYLSSVVPPCPPKPNGDPSHPDWTGRRGVSGEGMDRIAPEPVVSPHYWSLGYKRKSLKKTSTIPQLAVRSYEDA